MKGVGEKDFVNLLLGISEHGQTVCDPVKIGYIMKARGKIGSVQITTDTNGVSSPKLHVMIHMPYHRIYIGLPG